MSRTLLKFFCASLIISALHCGGDILEKRGPHSLEVLSLSGDWTIITDGKKGAEHPGFDDSRAQVIAIPGKWDAILRKNQDLAATVWLRKKFSVDDRFRDRQFIMSLGTISIADETYLNGVFIGGTGSFPPPDRPLDYDFAWHYERNYTFNSSLLRYGEENVLAIKVFSHYINGIKDGPRLYTSRAWSDHIWIRKHLPSMNNFFPIILSLVPVLLLLIVVRGKVSFPVYLYSTLFVTSVIVIFLLLLGILPVMNGLHRYKLFFCIYTIIDFFLLQAVRYFFNAKSRVPFVLLLAALIGVNILIFASPTTEFFFRYGNIAALLFLLACVSYVFMIIALAVYKDPRRYWLISPLAVLIALSAAHTYYLVATDQMYRMSFAFVLRLAAIGSVALIYFLFDLKQIEKERDSLTRALMNKTRELQNTVRKLSPGKKKEDPRDIIHRLIEYIDENFSETYDRVGLAKKFGLNEDYMGQLFKKVTKTNIANYINCKRIEMAKQLLEETDSKVIDIAFHVGFDNLTYFYRHFRNKTGYNPTDYRKVKRGGFMDLEFDNEGDYY